jgi:23S rRNA-/tRNA-specific pseudouridylate synthase
VVHLPLADGVVLLEQHTHGLVALSKPDGIMSHPNESQGHPRALLTCAYDLQQECFYWSGGEFYLLHRLDSPTSGVILGSLDAALAREVKLAFQTNQIQKTYRALVFGVPRETNAIWTDRLEKRGSGSLRVRGQPNAETQMRVLQTLEIDGGVVCELELKPKTGRTHQLRVQAAARGLPMVGDGTYGDFAWNRQFAKIHKHKRLFLHALEVAVRLESKKLEFSAFAPLPEAFNQISSRAKTQG